jgi:hypothetical protein
MFKIPFGVIRCFNQTLVAIIIVATDRLPVHCLFLGDVRGDTTSSHAPTVDLLYWLL